MKKINSTTRKYHSFDRSAGTQQERLKVLSVCQNWPTKSISLKVEYNILKDRVLQSLQNGTFCFPVKIMLKLKPNIQYTRGD